MRKPYSKIIGTNVISDRAETTISLISGVHIDPENGNVVALQCGFKNMIAPVDIISWKKAIHVADNNSLTTKEHLLRLQNLDKEKEQLIFKSVFTEDGKKIGRVYDYVIDTDKLMLWQLIVKNKFFFMTTFETIISWKNIIEIQKNKIIVKDHLAADKVRVARTEAA